MKNELTDFFTRFHYEADDTAFLLQLYDRIMANAGCRTLWEEAVAAYRENIGCDFGPLLERADLVAETLGVHAYSAEFLLAVCLTGRMRQAYAERGISEKIFEDTVLDLRYKLDECKLVTGIIGSFVANWFAGFFHLTRFCLGRLQFEVTRFREHFESGGRKLEPESPVINVHIPRSLVPLDETLCEESFRMAKAFFAGETGENCAFVCHSWLLYPENRTILSPRSNIYKFMSRFTIIKSGIDKHRSDLWRLFDTKEKNPARLPADTSARRAYIDHLKKGGNVGWGYGVFFL